MAIEDSTMTLTGDQIDGFGREGYVALSALTTAQDVAALRESYDRIFSQRAGRDEGNEFDLAGADDDGTPAALPQILNPAKYAPEMNQSRLLVNATTVARQLLGPDAKCSIAHAIYKPPRIGAETPWHQDAAYWNPAMIHKSISIWVPLQEATLENGCMQFVPRSHRMDVLPHQSINNDPRIHGLELTPDQMHLTRDHVSCPLPPGGATIHGGYMLHHTPPNMSDTPRRAIILMASVPGTPREKPLVFPWMQQKQTARQQRAMAAKAKTT